MRFTLYDFLILLKHDKYAYEINQKYGVTWSYEWECSPLRASVTYFAKYGPERFICKSIYQ